MEGMQYVAEGAVKEFLLFRGFTLTLQSLEAELSVDRGNGFQVERIMDLVFSVYVPQFEAAKLLDLLAYLHTLSRSSAELEEPGAVEKLESNLKRYYIVHALQKGRPDRVLEFFEHYGEGLLHTDDDWGSWFALPYMKLPITAPSMEAYFSSQWLESLKVSFRTYVSEAFEGIQLPALLQVSSEKSKMMALEREVEQFRTQNLVLRNTLKAMEDEISSLGRGSRASLGLPPFEMLAAGLRMSPPASLSSKSSGLSVQAMDILADPEVAAKVDSVCSSGDSIGSEKPPEGCSPSLWRTRARNTARARRSTINYTSSSEPERPDFETNDANGSGKKGQVTPVAVQYQETYSGHTAAISKCRYSSTGSAIASASVDGTVRIWAPDVSAATSRNATINTGAEVLSLDWEGRSDRLLLLGTAERNIKVWNVESKRVECDLTTEAMFPRVLDVKCSPTDPIFCCAAASEVSTPGEGVQGLGYGSLTLWNMSTWKATTSLSLGHVPPVITSVSFSENGNILAAGATDGMILLFDLRADHAIKGRWQAHKGSPVSCVRFSNDQGSIFSLGGDGKVLQSSLQNQGQILHSKDASLYCASTSYGVLPRHELAIDSGGRHLLLSSNLVEAPLYQWGSSTTQSTLENKAAVTSVDWHPTLPMFVTGSADHSVLVTAVG